MKVKELREVLAAYSDDADVFVATCGENGPISFEAQAAFNDAGDLIIADEPQNGTGVRLV